MIKQILFTVPGEPQGKGRPRVTRYGTYTPEKTKQYEEEVRLAWKRESGVTLNGVPLAASITAYFEPPRSASKKKRLAMLGTPHAHKPDADNIAKAILDALNGLAYEDDARVSRLSVCKEYAQQRGVRVLIVPMEDEP